MIPTVETKPFAIFDMDGTLVDSMWGWNEIYITFLVAHGAHVGLERDIYYLPCGPRRHQ